MSVPIRKFKKQMPDWDDKNPGYVSGKKSNPHAAPNRKTASFYKDHGVGNHDGEDDDNPKTSTRKIW